jgi:type VI secretion system protein ImpG
MTEELLPYYNRELAFLRRMGAEFARAHPKIAGRLRLGPDSVEDPHVARLIESAAFLNARIRHKLDDDFPELTDALLGVLYPHYLAPIPSMAIVQFQAASDASATQHIPVGTMLETDRTYGEACRYRTCYETAVHPIEVQRVELSAAPFEAPRTARSSVSAAVLRIVLRTPSDGAEFGALAPDRLRFYLGGQIQDALALYELLLNDVLEVAVATSPQDRGPQILGAGSLRPVGFGADEGVLPYPKRSAPGYRLLTEYFAFPAKFLFVDLTGIAGPCLERAGHELSVFVYLRRSSVDLQRNISPANFVLGCTPIVNLFAKRAEPTRLSHREPEVRVIPDARRPLALEVYSVDRVSAAGADGSRIEYRPFYGIDHGPGGAGQEGAPAYFHAVRRAAERTASRPDKGTEVSLQLVDADFRTSIAADSVLTVETTCLNRDLPSKLPFGGDHPRMKLTEGGGAVEQVRCLTPPTATVRQRSGEAARWRLVSHLLLNHLSLTGDEDGAKALKEILRLYEFVGSASSLAVIDSILGVASRPTTVRIVDGTQCGFCRGTEVVLHLNEESFGDHGLFLFASVLESFLGLYCSMNSFMRLAVTTNGREGVLRRWQPRAGTGPLL